MPLSFVKNICRKAKRILREKLYNMDFKRVLIPKKKEDADLAMEYIKKGVTKAKEMEGVTFRPLGVPTHA